MSTDDPNQIPSRPHKYDRSCRCVDCLGYEARIAQIVSLDREAIERGRAAFKELSERHLARAEALLLADPELGDADTRLELARMLRARIEFHRALPELARNLFPIEPMPEGALPVYDRDPYDVAQTLAEDPEERT